MTNPLFRQATDKIDETQRKVQQFFDTVEGLLSYVPEILSFLVNKIREGLEWLNQKLQELWDKVRDIEFEPGDSDRLKQVADAWVNEIGNRLGDIAGTISPDKLKTTYEWRGSAADAYKNTIPAQVSGLNSVKDIAGQMKSSLTNLANAIDNFWTAIIAAFAVFIVAIVGAIAAACTVVGAPAAIGAVAAGVGACLGLVIAAYVAMQNFAQTVQVEQGNIRQKIHDDLSSWAKSNIGAMGHASVNDPDGMDWHVNS